MRKWLFFSILFILPTAALAQDSGENAAKAEIILSLMKNIEWPASADSKDAPFVISVVGDSKMTPELIRLAQKKSTEGRRVEIRTVTATDDFTQSQIVFIATKDLPELAEILKRLKASAAVTVSDAGNFAGFGVMIDFMKPQTGDSSVTYAVNRMSLKSAGLKMSEDFVKKAKKTYG